MTPNYWKDRKDSNGNRHNPIALVLHITDGSSDSALNWIKNPQSQVSYNWLVDERGKWIEVVPEKDAAWANGHAVNPTWPLYDKNINSNLRVVSVGVANKGQFPHIPQWISWARGCRDIMERYNLPKNNLAVVNHYEIKSSRRCPRPYFTRQWLFFLLHFI